MTGVIVTRHNSSSLGSVPRSMLQSSVVRECVGIGVRHSAADPAPRPRLGAAPASLVSETQRLPGGLLVLCFVRLPYITLFSHMQTPDRYMTAHESRLGPTEHLPQPPFICRDRQTVEPVFIARLASSGL